MKRYYKQIEFSNRIGVTRQSIRKWKETGKLVPFKDEKGKEYYTEEQAITFDKVRYGCIVKKGGNWIDYSNIEKEKTTDRLDWNKAASEKKTLKFLYKGIQGELKIIEYKNRRFIVEYNDKKCELSATSLSELSLDQITGAFSKKYKYNVGDTIKKGSTDITILKQIRSKNKKRRAYEYICNKCKQINEVDEYNLKDTGSCSICSEKRIVEGVNDIYTKEKWMIKYFTDENVTKNISRGSSEMFYFRCPDCGRIKDKPMRVCTLYRTRSIGCICSDGYSYPNKFMYNVLEQLFEQNEIVFFDKEYSPIWLVGRKFDFVVEQIKAIIEMDGGLGHGNKTIDKAITPEYTKEIDEWKDKQAKKNGYTVYRIDSTISEKEYLKEQIENTIGNILNFSNVDWERAEVFAITNLTKTVCQYYEKNKEIGTEGIARVFNISQTTVMSYLNRGSKYGWCEYDWDGLREKRSAYFKKQSIEKEKRVIEVCEYYKNNKPILAIELAKVFNIHVSTVLDYLKEGEKMGYEPYDIEYRKEKNMVQIKNIKRSPKKRVVLCFSLEKKYINRFDTCSEASKTFGVSTSAICQCCKKKGTSVNHIFRYEDDCEIEY